MVETQKNRVQRHILCGRLYGDMSLRNVAGTWGPRVAEPSSLSFRKMSDNAVQSIIDSATAAVGENRPRPYFLANGGNYRTQRKAKKRNQFTDGLFHEVGAYDLGSEAQRGCEIFGDHWLYVHARFDRVCVTSVMDLELWVDEMEAAYGNPRSLHYVRAVDRQELLAWVEASENFKDEKDKKAALDAVKKADRSEIQDRQYNHDLADMVTVAESWHLASSPKGEDGKHCMSVQGALIDPMLQWKHPWFPMVRWRWSQRPMAPYRSQGLCEQLKNKQVEVNEILGMIQKSFHLASTFKVFIPMGSEVSKEHINNEIGSTIKYTGDKPPQYVVPQVVPAEYYEHYTRLVQSMYERAGMSLMLATGEMPPGIKSGEAQRVYNATTNRRFKTVQRYNETAFIDLTKKALAIAGDIAEGHGGHYSVTSPQRKYTWRIDLADCRLEDDDYTIQCFPTSSLPTDPAGRLETITEYIQAGMMTQRQGRRALDFPDLESIESLANAAEDLVTWRLDKICDDGEYVGPSETDDLQLDKELVIEYLQRGELQELDTETMDKLRLYLAQTNYLNGLAQQGAMQAQMQAQAASGAPPATAPAPGLSPAAPAAPVSPAFGGA